MTMIERVARALCKDEGVDPDVNDSWQAYESNARAAIAAMREPSKEMREVGNVTLENCLEESWDSSSEDGSVFTSGYLISGAAPTIAWRAMIDAALDEEA